jgi:hypothetical protein
MNENRTSDADLFLIVSHYGRSIGIDTPLAVPGDIPSCHIVDTRCGADLGLSVVPGRLHTYGMCYLDSPQTFSACAASLVISGKARLAIDSTPAASRAFAAESWNRNRPSEFTLRRCASSRLDT